jgi:NAD(P)-dependent dehydrogenase (short-subunit alcohol dehydrogenase family)
VNSVAPLSCVIAFQSDEETTLEKTHINVSAMEGNFILFKEDRHPHTNMAKAALNMLTTLLLWNFGKDFL